MLLIECLPLFAQFPDFERKAWRVQRLRRRGFGALAQLNAGSVLAERFPAFELDHLLQDAVESLHRRLRQHAGALDRLELISDRASALQLSRDQCLLGYMQQTMNILPCCVRFLLRDANLRQPALLDHRQRGVETPRQRRRSNRLMQCLPPLWQIRVVYQLDAMRNVIKRSRESLEILLPLHDALICCFQFGKRGVIGVPLRLFTQRSEFGAQGSKPIRRCGRPQHTYPFAQPALKACPYPLLILLAIETCLKGPASGIAARETSGIAAHVQYLPTAIEFNHRPEYRAGVAR